LPPGTPERAGLPLPPEGSEIKQLADAPIILPAPKKLTAAKPKESRFTEKLTRAHKRGTED